VLGILCGLESEAALARRASNAVVASAAARPQKARWLARELIKKGVTRLLSFGVAGGLEPGLPVGTLVLGTQVASRDGNWVCDSAWLNALSQKLPAAHCGGVWGSEIIVPTASDKRMLYEKSHCLIVDMESQCVAQIASEAKIPFAVMRAVCDTSDMTMPPVVMAAINEDGSTNYKQVLLQLLRHPGQIPSLFHVGRGIGKALKVLEKSLSALE
jgi:adenosylhomocysteine nucleosidase